MEWDTEIDLTKRKLSSQLIIQRALARGWRVAGYKTTLPLLELHIPGRDQPVRIYGTVPPQMNYTAVKIANDKAVTSEILRTEGFPMPQELCIDGEAYDAEQLYAFLKTNNLVVTKPLDASHGLGITTHIHTLDGLHRAINVAMDHTRGSRVLVQRQLIGVDIRVLCIDYRYVDAISRRPASVTGDDEHTISQLIAATNLSPERGVDYSVRLNNIPADKAAAFLGESIERIPKKGEVVQVVGVSNVGMGGERINIRPNLPLWLRKMAEDVASTLMLPVCGIDFIANELPSQESTLADLQPHIIEANGCPGLVMYEDIDSLEQVALIDSYLDYVARTSWRKRTRTARMSNKD